MFDSPCQYHNDIRVYWQIDEIINLCWSLKPCVMIWFFLIPVVLLLIGLADLPTGFYTLVRIVVCIVSALCSYWSYMTDEKVGIGTVVYALLAILFNPIIPIYFHDKGTWMVMDIIAAVLLVAKYVSMKSQNQID